VKHWKIPSPSDAKNRQAFFIRDGWVYMFGGNNSTGQHDFDQENFLAEGYKLNLATMNWRPCSEYPMPRQSIQTLMSGDMKTGFSLGGFGFGNDAATTHAEGCTYDFSKNSWEVTGPHLPVSRSQFGLARHEDEVWVFGGLDYDPRREDGDQFRHLQEVMVADTAKGDEEFSEAGIMLPNTRRAFGGVTVGGKYYMIGGMTDDFELVPPCDVFDFESRTWAEITPPARTRLSPEAVVIGNHIFVAGGMSPKLDGTGLEPNKSLEMYDTSTDTWKTVVAELPFALRHITMMPYRSQLLVFSSHESDSNMAHVVLINPYKVMMPNVMVGQASN
jgi:N-acetylneuraminic acid mutarotase